MRMEYTFSSTKPNLNNRLVRIYVPIEIRNKIKDKFVIINLNNKTEFIEKIKEKRLVIPKRLKSKIKFLDKNIITIKEINSNQVSKEIIKNGKFKLMPAGMTYSTTN